MNGWRFERNIIGIFVPLVGMDYEDSCSSCEHLTKSNHKQEDFNDHLDKRIHFMVVSQSYRPQTLLSLPKSSMNKMTMILGIKFTQELENINYHPPRRFWLKPLLNAQTPTSRARAESPVLYYSPRTSCSKLVRVNCTGPFYNVRSSILLPQE